MKKKLDDTNSVWNYFGILKDATKNGNMVEITSNDGHVRMMSINKYKQSAQNVLDQAQELIGKEVEVRTSQSTRTWNENKWFSAIKEF